MSKPVARLASIDLWILLQQGPSGQFSMVTTHSSNFGLGFYLTEQDALMAQLIELLKGNKVNVFLIEWPVNAPGETK